MYRKIIWGIFVVLILFLSTKVRANRYESIPIVGVSMDEYSFSWVGMSLFESRYPIGISGIGGYKNELLKYVNVDNVFMGEAGGNPFKINYPWFDHPPLLGLFTGGYAKYKGAVAFEDARSFLIRKPMLWFGTLTTFSLMMLMAVNFGYLASIFTGLIWTLMPMAVLSSRMVQAENGFIPFWLLSLVFLSLYKKYKTDFLIFMGALFAGICVLFKLSGMVAIISGGFYLAKFTLGTDKTRDLKFWFFVSLLVASLFLVYGLLIDPNQFARSFFSNSNRYYGIGPEALFNLIRDSKLTNHKFVLEPWLLAGWISAFILLFKKKVNILTISWLGYLFIYIFFGSYAYGWYSFPFWPILVGMFGKLLSDGLFKSKGIVGLIIILFMVLGGYISKLIDIQDFQDYVNYWRLGISFLTLVYLLIQLLIPKFTKLYGKMLVLFLFIACLCLTLYFLDSIDINTWYKLK